MALYSKPKPGKMDPKPCRRCGAPGTVRISSVSESGLASADSEGWFCGECLAAFRRNDSATS